MEENRPVIILAGPTASGKSALALNLAMRGDGEIVNADSMQVYRDLPCLTAVPSMAEREAVPHHNYAVLDGAERCSVARWLDMTRKTVAEIRGRGRVPVLVGGTGLYIRAALSGITPLPDIPPEIRDKATALHRELGGRAFREKLAAYDPDLAGRLEDGDSQRLVRGMEVAMATGQKLSELQQAPPEGALPGPFQTVLVMPERAELYARIDARLPRMLENGAIDEARRFAARDLDPSLPLMKAVGLPPLLEFTRGLLSQEEAAQLACRDTRRYAKRQITWFRHQFSAMFCEKSRFGEQYSESFFDKILSKVVFKG
ncbi:tRNA (adenosine(37)-N6)-dimethylallyltransferase MiaA [Alphaproteobacteria bacterium LSUCC0684]